MQQVKIKTDRSIYAERAIITQTISRFWDKTSEGWRAIWGPHLHHGYYADNISLEPLVAQEKLIDQLVALLKIEPHMHILDAGSGMGGSSLYLAKKYAVKVTGITLSSKQVAIATQQMHQEQIKNVTFKIEDALALGSFADNSVDIIWSLESCEQFFDKHLFIKQARRVLKPGGQLLLATWCSDRDEYEGSLAKKYHKLCKAFDLPYMPTIAHYHHLLERHEFAVQHVLDWSAYVKKSWDVGVSLVAMRTFLQIFKLSGWRGLRFAQQIRLMQKAFHEGRVRYGVLVGVKS